jgi:hypothetical protein
MTRVRIKLGTFEYYASRPGDEMSSACSTGRREESCVQNFDRKKLKEKDHRDDLGVDGMVLKWIKNRMWEC